MEVDEHDENDDKNVIIYAFFFKPAYFFMKKGWMVQQPASPVEESYPLVGGFHSLQMITCMTEHRNNMTNN